MSRAPQESEQETCSHFPSQPPSPGRQKTKSAFRCGTSSSLAKVGKHSALRLARKGQGDALGASKDVLSQLWVDITQNVDRGHRGSREVPSFTTGSLAYSFAHDCTLSGQGQMRLLGWPSRPAALPLELYSNSEARNLSGDAFAVPMACSAMLALFLNERAPWWAAPTP